MAQTIVALFDEYDEAQSAVQELVNRGFERDRISIAANQQAHEAATGALAADASAGDRPFASGAGARTQTGEHGMTAGDAAGAGAVAGTVVGGIAGVLLGVGLLAIPGLGPLIAAGPLIAMFTGAGVGAAAGGLAGALTSLGVPREHAEYFTEAVRRGGTLVAVEAPDDRVGEAESLLTAFGGGDIEQRGGQYMSDGTIPVSESASSAASAKTVAAGSTVDASDPHSANLGGASVGNPPSGNTSEFRTRSEVDRDTDTSLVDAQAHADSDVGDLAGYMDPGRSHLGAFDDRSPDVNSTTGV